MVTDYRNRAKMKWFRSTTINDKEEYCLAKYT
jgi:hypothetical protein